MPPLGMNPSEVFIAFKVFIAKTRVVALSVGEYFVTLAYVVLTQCQRVTDYVPKDGWTVKHADER